MLSQTPWAVVGGGLLGMTIAHTLGKAGRRVTLFESASEVGGLASAWEIGGITWDRYYHVTLMSDLTLRSLLDELNLGADMCWRKTRTGFYQGGALFPFSNAIDFLKFPLLNPIEKLRLGLAVFYASRFKDWKSLETVSVEDWLVRLSGKSVFEKIWRPLLLAKLGEDFRTTSATFIWATIQRMYAARKNGIKEERFGYLPGGYSRMLKEYQSSLKQLNVTVKVNAPVEEVTSGAGGPSVSLRSGETMPFERVIVTAPAPLAERICPQLNEAERNALKAVPYLGIVCISILLKHALSDCYITNILDESIPFTGLIEMSALVDRRELGEHHLIYVPRYLRPDHPDFSRPDDDLAAEAGFALRRMYPKVQSDDLLAVRVSKARYVFRGLHGTVIAANCRSTLPLPA